MILPHGCKELVNRIISEDKLATHVKAAQQLQSFTINQTELSVFYRIADGTLSPLKGPMDGEEFHSVLDREYIERDGKRYAWTIPISFSVSDQECKGFKKGDRVSIKKDNGQIIGELDIRDIFVFDKDKYNNFVYGTDRKDHPGPRISNENTNNFLLGGDIIAFPEMRNVSFGKYMFSPQQARKIFEKRKWQRIVAFQTRNPLHRAHEYAMVYAAEKLTREGYFTGVGLNPIVGQTKSDDVPADIRMKTYEALVEDRLIGYGDKDEELWKEQGYDLMDQMFLAALDMKMFYAGPKEAIMHAIYRQNLGFTDIIIGRKHADAPFDDGSEAWGNFDAQNKFEDLKGELLIKPFKVGFAAYFKELGRVGLAEEYKSKGYTEVTISGKELRQKLQCKEPIDERIMRKEVADILSDAYQHSMVESRAGIKSKNITWHDLGISRQKREVKNGHKTACIWLTGLSCSGKSTIAVELQMCLFDMGCQVFILDGDNIRHGLNKDLGFSPEDRVENIRRIGEVAKLFTEAGFLVITAFISPYKKERDNARALFAKGDFLECFIKTDLATCEKRDTKGLYAKARRGEIKEFTGISASYEEPDDPEIVINNINETKDESAKHILDYLVGKGYVQKG